MRFVIVFITGVICVAAAQAQLIYPIEQERALEAQVYGNLDWPEDPNGQTDSASAAAADMQPWLQSIDAVIGIDPYYSSAAGAGQYSEIGGTALTAYGLTEYETVIDPFLADSQAISESRYRVQFAVPETTSYQMSGAIAASADVVGSWETGEWQYIASVSVTLDQIAGPVVYSEQAYVELWDYDPDEALVDSRPVVDFGQLSPGVYELEVVATVEVPLIWGWMFSSTAFVGETSYIVELEFTPAQPGPGYAPIVVEEEHATRRGGGAGRAADVPRP